MAISTNPRPRPTCTTCKMVRATVKRDFREMITLNIQGDCNPAVLHEMLNHSDFNVGPALQMVGQH